MPKSQAFAGSVGTEPTVVEFERPVRSCVVKCDGDGEVDLLVSVQPLHGTAFATIKAADGLMPFISRHHNLDRVILKTASSTTNARVIVSEA